jgi:transcription termination/antitermination protein NusG
MIPYAEVSATAPWVALVVRPQAERKVQSRLANVGIESFVPWHRVGRRWSDRLKVLEQNLFPGYVFCRSTFADRMVVMRQPGVRQVVGFNNKPALIPDSEVTALRRTVSSDLPLGPWPFLRAGQRVRIERGVLAGLEGTLARDSPNWRVVISIEALQRSIAVEVDRDMICPQH